LARRWISIHTPNDAVGAFNATTKDNSLIPMGTPDPYTPAK
jgi:hypothetical protein